MKTLATKADLPLEIGLLRQDLAIFKRDMIIWLGGIIIAANIISCWVMVVLLKTLISGA